MPRVGKIKWPRHPEPFLAEEVEDRGNGTFRMKALEKGPRFTPGTEILVLTDEIEWMPDGTEPPPVRPT